MRSRISLIGVVQIYGSISVTSGQDFKKVWSTIYSELNKNVAKVKEMHIFSHSSKTDGGNDGLEFLSTRNSDNKVIEDGTISYSEISGLEKLRWSLNANLVLHGCNTGLRGQSVQSIADVFAIRQEKCRVHGQKGWAYFSKKDSVYERMIYAELSGDFPLGDSRQPTYKSLRPFDLVS